MAQIFLVVGITKDPTRVWPVTWSVDEADSLRNVEVCKREAEAFIAELKPIWEAMEDLGETKPEKWGYRAGSRRLNHNFEHQQLVYDTKRNRLEVTEHEINAKHRDKMLDALFPTGNDGWCPEVDYIVWPLYEDMRTELTPAELMLIRAKLHADADDDSSY